MDKIFKCQHCLKEFKKQAFYKKHFSICEILNMRKQDDVLTIEYSNIQLVTMIQHLVKKQESMDNEIQTLKKLVRQSKAKLTIVEWLNEQYQHRPDFQAWFQDVVPTETDLQYIFNHDLGDGLSRIFIQSLHTENDDVPIVSFPHKPNILYVYLDKNWTILTNTMFDGYINKLNSTLIRLFKTWQDKHQHELDAHKFGEDYYPTIVRKIMGGDQSRATMSSKIRASIYHHVKITMPREGESD